MLVTFPYKLFFVSREVRLQIGYLVLINAIQANIATKIVPLHILITKRSYFLLLEYFSTCIRKLCHLGSDRGVYYIKLLNKVSVDLWKLP